MSKIGEPELARWRSMRADEVLLRLANHAKQDRSFCPVKDSGTTRWHASTDGAEFELLLTGVKFFDGRAGRGGGGAVDLAMHIFNVDFKEAAALLRRRGV